MLFTILTSVILQATGEAAAAAIAASQSLLVAGRRSADTQAPGPAADNVTCMDFPLHWVDSEGRSCPFYEERAWCTADGGYGSGWGTFSTSTFSDFAHSGHSAVGACCACSGGVRGELLEVLRPHLAVDETVSKNTTATTMEPLDQSRMHCFTVDGRSNSFGTFGRPTAADGTDCYFPFTWEGLTFNGCTTEQYDRMWCYVGPDSTTGWGNCRCEELTTTTTTTTEPLVRSEIHCFTDDRGSNTYGTWGRPTAADGTDCHFPFTWDGTTFNECSNVGYDRMWCYVGPDSTLGWGNCKCEELRYQREQSCRTTERILGTTADAGLDCHFPFEFDGQNYTDCTTARRGEGATPWCAVGTTIDAGWGNCACESVWVDVSSSSANVCIDMIQSYPDLDAWKDDCSYYVGREEQCGRSDTAQFKANMLCCACGGGHRTDHTYSVGDTVLVKNAAEEPWSFMTVSRMIPTMVVPMDSPEGTEEQTFSLLQTCSDSPLWIDVVWGEGNTTCADLAVDNKFGSPSEWCTAYGEASELVRQSCPMVCGTCMEVRGGVRPQTSEELTDIGNSQAMCSDMNNGQVDTDGDDCAYYQRFPLSCGCCDQRGSPHSARTDAQGFLAAELCCACGGGHRGRPGDVFNTNR